MSSIMRCRSGLMALSVMRDAPVLMEVANPSSQDRTPRRAIPLAPAPAAVPYRASGLVLWRKAAVADDRQTKWAVIECQAGRSRYSDEEAQPLQLRSFHSISWCVFATQPLAKPISHKVAVYLRDSTVMIREPGVVE